jgi:hypothetical protein
MDHTIPKAINASINLKMIDKSQILEGKKGSYINIRLVNTPDSEYGYDYMVTQDIPKELRDQGLKGPILGNGRGYDYDQGKPSQKEAQAEVSAAPRVSDDLPF